jgi:hypothetical protein
VSGRASGPPPLPSSAGVVAHGVSNYASEFPLTTAELEQSIVKDARTSLAVAQRQLGVAQQVAPKTRVKPSAERLENLDSALLVVSMNLQRLEGLFDLLHPKA